MIDDTADGSVSEGPLTDPAPQEDAPSQQRARLEAAIAAAEEGFAGAEANATTQLEESDASLEKDKEKTRRFVVVTLLAVYATALFIYSMWVIFSPSSTPGYVCSDQAQQAAGLCVGRWSATTEALKDVVVTWILPVLTLTIGYYFGKSTEANA